MDSRLSQFEGRDVVSFTFPDTGQHVRIVMVGGEPHFVAMDVCDIVGIEYVGSTLRKLNDRQKGVHPVPAADGSRMMATVTEAGVHRLIIGSGRPEAVAFQDWLVETVVPEIRRITASSTTPVQEALTSRLPQSYAEALRELASRVEEQERLIAALEATAWKAEAWDILASTGGDYSVRQAASLLNRDPNISTGQNRLFRALRELELIDSANVPYARHERHVRLRPRFYPHPRTGEPTQGRSQVRITIEGLQYLHRRLGGTRPFSRLLAENQQSTEVAA